MKSINRALVCLGLAFASAQAQAVKTQGTTVVDSRSHAFGIAALAVSAPVNKPEELDVIDLDEVRIHWRFDTLMGSPLYTVTGDYRIGKVWGALLKQGYVCTQDGVKFSTEQVHLISSLVDNRVHKSIKDVKLLPSSKFHIFIKDHAGVYLPAEPDALEQRDSKFKPSAVGSAPSWDKLFKRVGGYEDRWLPAEEAKDIFRKGVRVERVEMVEARFDLSALSKAHEEALRADCLGRPAKKGSSQQRTARSTKQARVDTQNQRPRTPAATSKPQKSKSSTTTTQNKQPRTTTRAPKPSTGFNMPGGLPTMPLDDMPISVDAMGNVSLSSTFIAQINRAFCESIHEVARLPGIDASLASFANECASADNSSLFFMKNPQALDRFIEAVIASGNFDDIPNAEALKQMLRASMESLKTLTMLGSFDTAGLESVDWDKLSQALED